MKTKAAIIALATLVLGAGAVYLLAPGDLELAAMKAREGQYRDALAAYEQLLAERGNRRDVVLPLADIYRGMGDDDAARRLLRTYVETHSGDLVTARRYADLLRELQEFGEEAAILETIAAATNDAAVWRKLERLYDTAGAPQKRSEALLRIADARSATLAELQELARLLAAQGDDARALAVSLRALRMDPAAPAFEFVLFHVALAMAAERPDLAEEALDAWNARHDRPADVLALSDAIEAIGAPGLALRLLTGSRPYAAADAAVRLDALRLGATTGDPAASFEALSAWQSAGGLPREGYALILDLGVNLGRYGETFSALSAVPLAQLPLNAQLTAVEFAEELSRRDLLENWRAEAGGDWRGLAPLTGAWLALALDDTRSATMLATRARDEAVSDFDRANAARALAGAGLAQEAGRIVAELGSRLAQGELAPDASEPLAEAALALGRSDIALAAARDAASRSKAPFDQALYARALIAAGEPREALGILARYDARDPAIEAASVAALLAAGERASLQALLYRRLADPALPRRRRNELLEALVDSAPLRPGAEPLLSGLAADLEHFPIRLNQIRQRDSLFAALSNAKPASTFAESALGASDFTAAERRLRVRAMALIDPAAAVRYAAILAGSSEQEDIVLHATLLKRGGRDAEAFGLLAGAAERARTREAKESFVESLIALGGIDAALPLLSQLAEEEGGEWRYAYEDALQQLGRNEALATALVRHAHDPATAREEKRDLAYALLDLGRKDEAERILQELAFGGSPASTEVENLFWLWGPRPASAEIAWMSAQARAARAEDKAGWVNRIIEAGDPRAAADLAQELLANSSDAALLEAAVRAHAALDDRQGVERILASAAARIDDAAMAEHFARLAQEAGANNAAGLLFEKAARLDARRIENLGLAGVSAFQSGASTRASGLLREYEAAGGRAPEARFALAELDLRDGNLTRARAGYEAVIAAAEAAPAETALLRMKALSLLRLHREEEAYAAYAALVAAAPADTELRASSGAELLDAGRIDEAGRILRYGLGNSEEIPRR